MNMVEAMGLEVTFAYADLVFVDHNAFLLQMLEDPKVVNLYFNRQSETSARANLAAALILHGAENGLRVMYQGLFDITQQAGETLKITFLT
jgi:hypothetical protein